MRNTPNTRTRARDPRSANKKEKKKKGGKKGRKRKKGKKIAENSVEQASVEMLFYVGLSRARDLYIDTFETA